MVERKRTRDILEKKRTRDMLEKKRTRDMLEKKRTQGQKTPIQGTLTKGLLQESSMGSSLGRIRRYLKRLRQ